MNKTKLSKNNARITCLGFLSPTFCVILTVFKFTIADASEKEIKLPPTPNWLPGKLRRGADGELYLEQSAESKQANEERTIEGTNVSLQWNAPKANIDGSRLENLAGYKIYYGLDGARYNNVLDVGNVTEYKILNLEPGHTYYFVVTAYNTAKKESGFSNSVTVKLEPVKPSSQTE